MRCPCCKAAELVDAELATGLSAHACGGCHGWWISAASYWTFVEGDHPAPARVADATPPHDSPRGKLCPACGKFLTRYHATKDAPFAIERCSACGGFWLDEGEFAALRALGLERQMHRITSDGWQHRVSAELRRAAHERVLEHKLGEADLAEARRVKAWIAAHPAGNSILAFLADGHS